MAVKEILVLRSGGQPLFNFAPEGEPKLDELVAGFISAQAGFAKEIGEGTIRIVSFAENKFVYESLSDLLFILVIPQEEDEHVYRLILKEIAEAFVRKYKKELSMDVPASRLFVGFRNNVVAILSKYDQMPRTPMRYPTALVKPEVTRKIEEALNRVEGQPGILRAALLTPDGYVVSSKLHPYELKFALNLLHNYRRQSLPTFFTVSQTTLGEEVNLLIHLVDKKFVLAAIIRKGYPEVQYASSLAPILQEVASLDTSSMVKVQPWTGPREAYSDHEVLAPNPISGELMSGDTPAAKEFRELFGGSGIDVMRAIDGVATVADLRERTGVTGRQLMEILGYLEAKGYIRKVQFYPKLDTSDTRFLAYLEVVGLPSDEFQVLEQAKHFCDGHNSVRDIALRIGVEPEKLVRILRKLGDYVEWLT